MIVVKQYSSSAQQSEPHVRPLPGLHLHTACFAPWAVHIWSGPQQAVLPWLKQQRVPFLQHRVSWQSPDPHGWAVVPQPLHLPRLQNSPRSQQVFPHFFLQEPAGQSQLGMQSPSSQPLNSGRLQHWKYE